MIENETVYNAGFRNGDELLYINQNKILSKDDMIQTLQNVRVGEEITIILLRNQELYKITLEAE